MNSKAMRRVDITVRCSLCRSPMAEGYVIMPERGVLLWTARASDIDRVEAFISPDRPGPVHFECPKHRVAVEPENEVTTGGAVTFDALAEPVDLFLRTGTRQDVAIHPDPGGRFLRKNFGSIH